MALRQGAWTHTPMSVIVKAYLSIGIRRTGVSRFGDETWHYAKVRISLQYTYRHSFHECRCRAPHMTQTYLCMSVNLLCCCTKG